MEALILEIQTAGLHQYYPLSGDVIRIGRALDNDIILSDPTVAPHHLRISRDENGVLHFDNLAAVNAAQINKQQTRGNATDHLPVSLEIGRIKARILSRDHAVDATRPLAKFGRRLPLFGQLFWAISLPLLCLLISGLQFYLESNNTLKWTSLVGYLLRDITLGLGAFIVVLSIIERLLVNRWEVKLVTIGVALVFLLFQLINALVDQALYVFSSHWPSSLFDIGWYLFFIPAMISLYLIHISHFKSGRSILLAILISSPYALPSILDIPTLKLLSNEFSASPDYHRSLSAVNWHLSQTVSVGQFVEQAQDLEPGSFVD